MELADAHCHLLDPWFSDKEINKVVQDAFTQSVSTIVNVGSTQEHYEAVIKSANFFDQVYANIGLQPTHVNDEAFYSFKNFVLNNKINIKAIGEVGLDYYWIKDERQQKIQRSFFKKIIRFANELNLPLVIHSRSAESDSIDLLYKYSNVPVLMHCFDGSLANVKKCIEYGFVVSIPTSVKNRKKYRKIAKNVPLENMTLETDAPFQSPFNGVNGKKPPKNEPKNILISCQKVSELHETTVEEVAKITTQNTLNFFNIK
ncbi:MAG: putative deoxyribonuclease YcfH [Candidatus Heimdallarchaeota archaeon LC_3]|nr:MAG: putative deoxyribonuclease YcfH [Candidatus Heimdallarchaeota archaeon LC_3]